jgi:DNA-3-methyladenine glycosylase
MSKLPRSFYIRSDVLQISKELLGKFLFTSFAGFLTGGMIIETEAYAGVTDRASHAYAGRRTARTETLYSQGGVAYIYLAYGLHSLFNIVTNVSNIPHAVLIRAIVPTHGISVMVQRRNMSRIRSDLTNGPGKLCQALAIQVQHNGVALDEDVIWLEDQGFLTDERTILTSPRVGIDYAGPDAQLPWRFRIPGPARN